MMRFQESQKFNQWWLWLLLVLLVIVPIAILYIQILDGHPINDNPVPGMALLILSAVGVLLTIIFLLMQLHTDIDENGIRMRFAPFVVREIPWDDVASAEVLNYGFVGGWGIRLWTSYGTVYNVRGNKGLAITLKNGKQFLIGTQKEEELRSFLDSIRS